MQPKLAKMAAARKFSPVTTQRRAGHTIAASNALSAEVAKLVAEYTGTVTRCNPGKNTDTWRKRGGSVMGCGMGAAIAPDGHKGVAKSTNGNYYELWGSGDRLVRR